MKIEVLKPASLSKPVGFAHGMKVSCGQLLFVAGQVAKDVEGKTVGRGDIVKQFEQAITNLKAVIDEGGAKMTDIVKLNMYVIDKKGYFAKSREIGEIYRRLFGKHFPAITLVQVVGLAEDDLMIEIEAVAAI